MKLQNTKHCLVLFVLLNIICLSVCTANIPQGWKKIFISSVSGSDNNDGTSTNPIETLAKAYDIADDDSVSTGFAILLKGGEDFTPDEPVTNSALGTYDSDRQKKAFIWDINMPLLITTYGNSQLAILGPGTETSSSDPNTIDTNALQEAIAITTPCKSLVTIENLHLKTWGMGGVQIYQYLPEINDVKLTLRDNVFEEIGTDFFPDEKYTTATGDLIYSSHAIEARESRNIEITGNIFKNCSNQLDSEHTTPYLMDSFHVFYINQSHNVEMQNNVVSLTSGTPVKVKAVNTYNVSLHDNAFFYTGPSSQIGAVQNGFVRCMHDAYINVRDNYFYCPFAWGSSDSDSGSSAYASLYSGDSTENITWVDNDVSTIYHDPGITSFSSMGQETDSSEVSYRRRYYDESASSFTTLNPASWTPGASTLDAYEYADQDQEELILGIADTLYNPYFVTSGSYTSTGWTMDALMYTDSAGVLNAWGSNSSSDSGWLVLDPPAAPSLMMVDDFNSDFVLSTDWTVTYGNTDLDNVVFLLNTTGDSKLSTVGLTADADSKWTTVELIHPVKMLGDFHIDFVQNWDQSDIGDMPKTSLLLQSNEETFAAICYKDSNDVAYGNPQTYTVNDANTTNGTISGSGTGNWEIDRINGNITIKLNDSTFATTTDSSHLDRIVVSIQGKYMNDPNWSWTWDDSTVMSVGLVNIEDGNNNVVFAEDFDKKPLSNSWIFNTLNTNLSSWDYTLNDRDSMLMPTSINPDSDVKWTSVFLTQTFSDVNDIHIDFDQTWDQNSINDKPYATLYLKSNGSYIATIGYEHKNSSDYGYPYTYTYNNSTATSGSVSQSGYSEWDIDRVNGSITIKRNGNTFATVNDTRSLDEILLGFQGRYMELSPNQWQWDSFPAMGVDLINVVDTGSSTTVINDSFNVSEISSSWTAATTNVDSWESTENVEFNSLFEITDIDATSDVKWTTVLLTQSISDVNDFHIEFLQNWDQDDVGARPYLKLFLVSNGSNMATIGYEDSSTTTYGNPHTYTYGNTTSTAGTASASGTAKWDIYRIDGKLTILLNGEIFSTSSENRTLDEIKFYIQGRYMLLSGYEWTWPTMGINLIKVEEIL